MLKKENNLFDILEFWNQDNFDLDNVYIGFDRQINCFNCKHNVAWINEYDDRIAISNIDDIIDYVLNHHKLGIRMDYPCNKKFNTYLPVCYKIKFNHLALKTILNHETQRTELRFLIKQSFNNYKIINNEEFCCFDIKE